MALSATRSFVQNCVVEDQNSFPDQICRLIWTHTHPGKSGLTTVTPGVPIRAPKWPKTPPIYTHFLTHLLQWFKSCRCGPKFLPRPNLPLHLISTTLRETTPQICDQRGPHPSPKMTQNTQTSLYTRNKLFAGSSLPTKALPTDRRTNRRTNGPTDGHALL